MKRTVSKLQLRRETLQTLETRGLSLVHGGLEPYETVVRPTDACPVATSK
jgi:hypothetical protein